MKYLGIGLGIMMLAGCGHVHLGRSYGREVKMAFNAQAAKESARLPPSLDAEDARMILAVHRGQAASTEESTGGGQGIEVGGITETSLETGGGGGEAGGAAPFRLEAK